MINRFGPARVAIPQSTVLSAREPCGARRKFGWHSGGPGNLPPGHRGGRLPSNLRLPRVPGPSSFLEPGGMTCISCRLLNPQQVRDHIQNLAKFSGKINLPTLSWPRLTCTWLYIACGDVVMWQLETFMFTVHCFSVVFCSLFTTKAI